MEMLDRDRQRVHHAVNAALDRLPSVHHQPVVTCAGVEMVDRDRWRVHHDINTAVDRLLSGLDAGDELRTLTPDGYLASTEGPAAAPAAVGIGQKTQRYTSHSGGTYPPDVYLIVYRLVPFDGDATCTDG